MTVPPHVLKVCHDSVQKHLAEILCHSWYGSRGYFELRGEDMQGGGGGKNKLVGVVQQGQASTRNVG